MRTRTLGALGLAAALLTACGQQQPGSPAAGGGAAAFPTASLQLIAPAAPGGGWDSTARTLQSVIEDEGLAPEGVEVVNIAGAGGTIGLSQFAGETDPHTLMVTGATLVGAVETNDSPASLDEVVPIARITEEHHVIVVPADSPLQDMTDLADAMKADLGAVSIAGGSAGGTDQITAGLIAQAVGVDPKGVNYVAFSGGGESLAAILGGQVTAAISNVQEYAGQIEAGELRALGVTSPEPIEGFDAPTLTEQGIDVTFANWRCILAPPGTTDEQAEQITAFLDEVHSGAGWQQALEENGWTDAYQSGAEFDSFLDEQVIEIRDTLTQIGLVQ
ncbi:tripartite tricarboxylate transporter substrate binding protein [Modestobacter sp. I12A-02662]|uniref:tripartite tricarboxylate transporter substrate binding protein n=1 Tax=Modestobacter sp. I12A-02662 TaxID=1730496 RepID=UPI0034E05257